MDTHAQTLVQGPPGTGKTYTAAALISHLLAQGKRVLVTAHTDRALKEVRAKLPAAIRPLAVSVVGSTREDMSDLRIAVERIAATAADHDSAEALTRIDRALRSIDDLRGRRAAAFHNLLTAREDEVQTHEFAGYRGTLASIAGELATDAERNRWLSDYVGDVLYPAPLHSQEIVEWHALLTDPALAADESDAQRRVFEPAGLPDPGRFADMVAREAAAAADNRLRHLRAHPAAAALHQLPFDARDKLRARLHALVTELDYLSSRREHWMAAALDDARCGRADLWRARHDHITQLIGQATQLVRELGSVTEVELRSTDIAGLVPLARNLYEHLAGGRTIKLGPDRRPKVGALASKQVKQAVPLFEAVLVDGLPPTTPAQLAAFLTWVDATKTLSALDRAWPTNVVIPPEDTLHERLQWHAPRSPSSTASSPWQPSWAAKSNDWRSSGCRSRTGRHRRHPRLCRASRSRCGGRRARRGAHAPRRPAAAARRRGALGRGRPVRALDVGRGARPRPRALRIGLPAARTAGRGPAPRGAPRPTWRPVEGWRSPVAHCSHDSPGDADGDWPGSTGSTGSRDFLRRGLGRRRAPSSGAGRHSTSTRCRLSSRGSRWRSAPMSKSWRPPARGTTPSPLTDSPGRPVRAWSSTPTLCVGWARAPGSTRCNRRPRSAKPWTAADPRFRCGSCRPTGSPTSYVSSRTCSTSSSSTRLRRPVWKRRSCSTWRRRIVVIGDDKQVSPSAVGVDQQQLRDLANQYLYDNPDRSTWQDPQRSLFDEAKTRSTGRLTLVEHRRCVPELIEFSNRIAYEPDGVRLVPVRQFGADRLDPIKPVFLEDGYHRGTTNKINPVEAEAIVEQIEKCCADPRYDGLTFGVISLLGTEQAKLIEKKLQDCLSAEWNAHDLRCGDAADFQGSERDVMFLSMVAAPQAGRRHAALTRDLYVQRYNVAASRAKDQMWLFHSIRPDDLSNKEDMRFRLLDYCYEVERSAQETDEAVTAPLPEHVRVAPFESLFEQRVCNRLVERGFSVIPQVDAPGYRLDLVVVGATTRLAIECDGDTWQGPAAYHRDMAAQRELERCGWTIVRVHESEFTIEQARALRPVREALAKLGIYPAGRSPVPGDARQVRRAADGASCPRPAHRGGAARSAPAGRQGLVTSCRFLTYARSNGSPS